VATVSRWLGERPQYLDSNGDPLASGRLFFYVAGTSTKANTYTTSAGSVANANPMVLDAAGRPQQMIFLDVAVTYDAKLCAAGSDDPPASAIWTEEDIVSLATSQTSMFTDDEFLILGSADSSKKLRFEVDGISASQTRVCTPPDFNFRLTNLPAGIIMDYGGSSAPTGWLECDGSAVSRTTYAALYAAISTAWGTGDGSTTFNLPDFRGRATIGVGTGTVTESVTDAAVATGTDAITVASNADKWVTGMQITWTVTGTPPTTNPANQLDNNDTVYVIRIDATTIKLASSLANAQNGTVIDITAAGSGTFTLTHTLTARTLGQKGGEQSHAMSITELLSHTHPTDVGSGNYSSGGNTPWNNASVDDATPARGGNAAMNIMQPYAAVMKIISI